MGVNIRVNRVRWDRCWRIIPAQYPRIPILETLCDQKAIDALLELEEMSNPRIRQEVGDLSLVPPQDRVSGPGSSYIMASFTHLSEAGSRFSDRTVGAYYAGNSLATAVLETVYHREEFFGKWKIPRGDFPMRVLVAALDGRLHDIRARRQSMRAIYSRTSYRASQRLAAELRLIGSNGIVYDSVRHRGGECAAVFRPRLLSHCRDERVLIYHWDGDKISGYTPLTEYVRL